MDQPNSNVDSDSGTARLLIVTLGSLVGIFYAAALDYSLPLYFGALNETARGQGGSFPVDAWSVLWKYQQSVWIVGPFLAGLLSRRYGERKVWSMALVGSAVIPLALIAQPKMEVVKILALWLGFTGSIAWIAGVSLVQMVPARQKGLSNGLLMASLGVGSIGGAVVGRGLLYQSELNATLNSYGWVAALQRLFGITSMDYTPVADDFAPIFWLLVISIALSGILVGVWGQHPGTYPNDSTNDWKRIVPDLGQLFHNRVFWTLVSTLCLMSGPVFAAANQFLPYRAEELGLKAGSADHGWIWLQLLRTIMWIPGGAAVGLIAGKRAPGIVGVAMLAGLSLTALAIGFSNTVWQLFIYVALFEFARQFMRWSHSGYLSEHMPENLRATAIGCAITFAGVGGTIASWVADKLWSPAMPAFQARSPYIAGATIGLLGSILLLILDRIRPIRDNPARTPPTESAIQ